MSDLVPLTAAGASAQAAVPERRLFVGLMSGTSADAIDAVLVACQNGRFERVLARHSEDYPAALREKIVALGRSGRCDSLEALADLEAEITECFAAATQGLLNASFPGDSQAYRHIEAIGCHGQTVFHRGGLQPATMQLCDGGRLAERTRITTVCDFRRRDIALGGQGAPLVPAFHHALFASATCSTAVLNLGGIANVTLLPNADPTRIRGFDTGPANTLLDEWCQIHTGCAFDAAGAWGATGTVVPEVLSALLSDPYFQAPPPKSTGRGDFHLQWAQRRAADLSRWPAADIQASFAELTAQTVAAALADQQVDTQRLLVCGGGIRNADVLNRLRKALEQRGMGRVEVDSTAAEGLDPQAVEGAAFAWLAMRALDGQPGNIPGVTGARCAAILGAIYPRP